MQYYVGLLICAIAVCALTYNVLTLLDEKFPQCNYHPFWYGFMAFILIDKVWLVWAFALIKFLLRHNRGVMVPDEDGHMMEISPERYKKEQMTMKYRGKDELTIRRIKRKEKAKRRDRVVSIVLSLFIAWAACMFMFGLL